MKFKKSTKPASPRKPLPSSRKRTTTSSKKVTEPPAVPSLDLRDDHSVLSTKIRFLWARTHSFYRKIPAKSVMREICEYVGDVQKPIAVLEDEVRWFNEASGQWKQLFSLRDVISVSLYSCSTEISHNRIFTCGGGAWPCTFQTDKHAYVLETDGTVQQLPDMLIGRCMHGITWDSISGAIYAFGACGSYAGRRCEQFKSSKWLRLPDMRFERFHFNPCWYSSVVYLCGGWHNPSVETYNPSSNCMNLLDLTLPMDSHFTAVVQDDTLIVISYDYISALQQGEFISQKHSEHYWPTASCVPVVRGTQVSIVALLDNCYREIDLTTGVLLKEVSL